ncbi:MAG TPA: hypothetical protein VFQ80_00865 [Thermomicrobiales bacterium]|nr:hypothetical protein [Thermomicrobiales bacterium]
MPTAESEPRRPTWRELLAAYDRARDQWERDPSPHAFELLVTGGAMLTRELHKPGRVDLGQVLLTPGASDALLAAAQLPAEFLLRHHHGDWGELDPEDRRENERALRLGGRLLSSYRTRLDAKLWIITEWDRSATTLLLPEEY